MSLLAPLYALGVLAVSLPVLFHLIQRRPRSELVFSSLMFLSPTPPRLTRRSRLNHVLLLLLRGAAIVLLAFAFARPFLRGHLLTSLSPPGQRILLLMDTSASMRREGLWDQAQAVATQVVKDLHAADDFALLTFDQRVRVVLGFSNDSQPRRAIRDSLVRDTVKQLQPTWGATDLGAALATAVDVLREAEGTARKTKGPPIGQILLVTDLQQGSQLDALRSLSWPADVRLDLRPVKPATGTNASLRQLSKEVPPTAQSGSLRIRITNSEASQTDRFRLRWTEADGHFDDSTSETVQVPPGQSRAVSIKQHPTARQLVLEGDRDLFDNTLYIAHPETKEQTVVYLGPGEDQRDTAFYFLKRAVLDTPHTKVTVGAHSESQPLFELKPVQTPIVVVDQPLSSSQVDPLRAYVERGGHVLVILCRDSGVETTQGLRQFLQDDTLQIAEAELADYAMLRQIDFHHPIFAPFANPRFNDFTKIRFWNHRRLTSTLEEPTQPTWTVLADFDDRDPALVEQAVGRGRIWILTSSWAPNESQLALSTKFIPLLAGMVRLAAPARRAENYDVDQQVIVGDPEAVVVLPDGDNVPIAEAPFSFHGTQQPGIYQVLSTSGRDEFAVNVAAEESQTAPMDPVELERLSVPLSSAMTTAQLQQREQQAQDAELESRQQIWRWLIATTLVVLAIETFLAGRLTQGEPGTPSA